MVQDDPRLMLDGIHGQDDGREYLLEAAAAIGLW